MQRLLIIGCGDIGMRAARLLASRYRVYALVRNPDHGEKLRAIGVTPVFGDLDQRATLQRIAGLAQLILHFAPPPGQGKHDTRTRNLLAALGKAASLPQHLTYISTSGVYGNCGGALVPETRPIQPTNLRALRRADAERQLRAWGRRSGTTTSILRVPGIYSASRLPLERLKKGTPALLPDEDAYTNHIHAQDLAHAAIAALHRGRPCRIYNASDGAHMKMGDYFDLVADAFDLPHPPRVSWAEAKQRIPESLLSFMSESRRLVNTRLKRELGLTLLYPDVASGMHHD